MTEHSKLFYAKEFRKSSTRTIYDWAIGDLRRCCRLKKDGTYKKGAGSMIGAFMLWCCAIDYYGGLRMGVKQYKNWRNENIAENYSARARIKTFVKEYLSKYGNYDPEKIYKLRNSLLHNYTLNGYTVVGHDAHTKINHLKSLPQGEFLHLGASIEDLELSVKDYIKELKKSDDLTVLAFDFYKLNPMLMASKG